MIVSLIRMFCLLVSLGFMHKALAEIPLLIADDNNFVMDIRKGNVNGVVSGAHSLLFRSLGSVESIEYMPIKRAMMAIDDSTEATCLLYRVSTKDRQAKYLMTKPLFFVLNQKLYQLIESPPLSADLLNESGHVKSLAAIFKQRPQSRLLLLPHRSYGDVIDNLIAEIPEKHLLPFININMHSSTSKMFLSKRAEFSITYPGEMFEIMQGVDTKPYRSYPIAGTNEVMYGRIMCNKHPQSNSFVERVNELIPALVSTSEMRNLHVKYNTKNDADTVEREYKKLQTLLTNSVVH